MPPQQFLEDFVPIEHSLDMDSLLAARRAFCDVPARADDVAGICGPLLCRPSYKADMILMFDTV